VTARMKALIITPTHEEYDFFLQEATINNVATLVTAWLGQVM
jgi:hypothetical protein